MCVRSNRIPFWLVNWPEFTTQKVWKSWIFSFNNMRNNFCCYRTFSICKIKMSKDVRLVWFYFDLKMIRFFGFSSPLFCGRLLTNKIKMSWIPWNCFFWISFSFIESDRQEFQKTKSIENELSSSIGTIKKNHWRLMMYKRNIQ